MKVVLCSYDGRRYFGGPYAWIKRLGLAFRKEGIEVVYFLIGDHERASCELVQFAKANKLSFEFLPRHTVSQWNDNTEERVRWFKDKALHHNPEFFVANNVLYALYAARELRMAGIKSIGVSHVDAPNLDWFEDIFVKDERWRLSETVFVSQFLYDAVVGNKYPGLNGRVIPCGTPVKEKVQQEFSHLRILYSGKLTQHPKRIVDTFNVIADYLRMDESATFTIIGDGPEKPEILSRIEREASPRIRYAGLIESEFMLDEIQRCNVFILLSEFEGLPIALMEAMGAGLVPIVFDIRSGIPELVTNRVEGFVVNDRKQSVIESLQFLKSNPLEFERMSNISRLKILDGYSEGQVVRMWLNLFNDLRTRKDEHHEQTSSFLPAVHPSLMLDDVRKPSFLNYTKNQLKRASGVLKRMRARLH